VSSRITGNPEVTAVNTRYLQACAFISLFGSDVTYVDLSATTGNAILGD
jgi:hypothetical protein